MKFLFRSFLVVSVLLFQIFTAFTQEFNTLKNYHEKKGTIYNPYKSENKNTNEFNEINLFDGYWEKIPGVTGSVWSICICENRLFVGTTENGLYCSDDWGLSWNKNHFDNVTDLFTANGSLFVGHDFKLFKSTDCGLSYSEFADDIYSLSHLVTEDRIYTGTGGHWVYISSDFGNSWVNSTFEGISTSCSYVRGFTNANGTIFVSTQDGIYKSNDNGFTWTNTRLGYSFEFTLDIIYHKGRLFAATGKGIYVSDNLGKKWQLNYNPYNVNKEYGYITSFASKDNCLFASSMDGVFFSDNAGASWKIINGGLEDKYVSKLFIYNNFLYAGTLKTLYKLDISELLKTSEQSEIRDPINEGNVQTFTDSRDNQVYKCIEAGNKLWMAENFRYKCKGSYCYNNNSDNCDIFGRLYEFKSAKKNAPEGWRLPTQEELKDLVTNYEGKQEFNALLGGDMTSDGKFERLNQFGFYWTSTKWETIIGENHSYYVIFNNNNTDVSFNHAKQSSALSVRYVKK